MLLNLSDDLYETGLDGSVSLGCWKFLNLTSLEEKDEILDGNYKNRSDAVHKCFVATRNQNNKVYAVSNGGSCQGLSHQLYTTYMEQGRSTKCAKDGKGGPGASQIYIHISKWIVYNIEYIYMFIYLSIHLYLSFYLSTYLYVCVCVRVFTDLWTTRPPSDGWDY